MKIVFKDFLSLKNVEFDIERGINVIAGKNGSGKSHLLLGLAHNYILYKSTSHYFLESYGYQGNHTKSDRIRVIPEPDKVEYRPAIRSLATSNRKQEYGLQKPMDGFDATKSISIDNFENRFKDLFSLLTTLKIAGTVREAKQTDIDNWNTIKTKFNEVFEKELMAESVMTGTRIGIDIGGRISKFSSLSTGELEFLSLLADLVIYKDNTFQNHLILIDEIDAHFHPDLQSKIINAIANLCKEKFVIITTHSPAVMLSVTPDRLFYLEKYQDCAILEKPNEYRKQITRVAEDSKLFGTISELYKGFSTDMRLVEHFSSAFNREVYHYAYECMKEPEVFEGEKGKETDAQISTIRDYITFLEEPAIAEIGCGRGRTFAMFNSMDTETISKVSYIGIDINAQNLQDICYYAKKTGIRDKLKSFSINQSIAPQSVDCCIFANVIHEIPVEILCSELTKYFQYLKCNGKIIIVECLELPVGEKQYIVFYLSSLKKLLSSNIVNSTILISSTLPISHGGIPLMNAVLTIKKPTEVTIRKEDLIEALNDIVEIETQALENHYSGRNLLSGKAFAFKTHNFARAHLALTKLNNNS